MAFKSFFNNAAAQLAVQKGDKTIDPRYTEAKATYRSLSFENEKIVGSVLTLQSQIRQLADGFKKLGGDCNGWFQDAPQDIKNRAATITGVSNQFHSLTGSFFVKNIEPNIITPLTEFQKEISRIQVMKDRHRDLCRDYDIKRINLKKSRGHEKDAQKLSEMERDTENAHKAYDQCNEEFIACVKNLADNRDRTLREPATKLVAILSQYLVSIFKEIQVYRTVIPKEKLEKQEIVEKPVYPEVKEENPYDAILQF